MNVTQTMILFLTCIGYSTAMYWLTNYCLSTIEKHHTDRIDYLQKQINRNDENISDLRDIIEASK